MSRTYTSKLHTKRKYLSGKQRDKRVNLADYDIEFIQMNLDPSINLSF